MNVHQLSGNLVVGPLTVDSTNNEVTVGSGITLGNSGTITATNFSGNGSGLSQVNSDQGSWVNGANSNIHLAVSTDKVGIGTVSPGFKLHVKDSDSYSVVGRIESKEATISGTSSSAYVDVVDGSGHGGFIQGHHDPFVIHGLRLGTWTSGGRDSAAISILNNGNVGIGKTDPKSVFHVSGNTPKLAIADNTEDDCDVNGFHTCLAFVDNTWNGSTLFADNPTAGMGFYLGHLSSSNKEVNMRNLTGELSFGTRNTGARAMYIDNDGAVGIGTTSPSEKLHVAGNIKSTNIYPDPIAFFAYPGGSNLVPANNSVVVWPNTQYNYGSGYSASTGKFTVPVQGIYLLTATMRVNTVYTGTSYFDIMHNSTRIVRSETARAENDTDPGSDHITAAVTYKASVNDTFYVYNNLNMQGDANNRIDNFSGVLITPF